MKNILTNPTVWVLTIILLVGGFLRLYNFPNYPYGLHQDEMNAGYEAWSLLNFGTDRWGYRWPVYFQSWGSGQNVLYSYLIIPLIAVLGPTDLAVRLGMVIVGIVLPLLVFFLTKLWFNKTVGLIAAGIVAVFPDLVRGSRWAVESNLVPFMVTVGLLCFSLALLAKKPKKVWIIFSLIPLALTPYSYLITAVPVLLTVIIMVIWKRETIKQNLSAWVGSFILFVITLVPLGLFFLKTTLFNNSPFFFEKWLPFSIPPMEESRYSQITEQSNSLVNVFLLNLKSLLTGVYATQEGNGGLTSQVPMVLVIIAIVLGFMKVFRTRLPFSIIQVWVLAALPLIMFVPLTNIRGNLFYVPSIIVVSALVYAGYGFVKKRWLKIIIWLLGVVYLIYASFWHVSYHVNPQDPFFYKGLPDLVREVDRINTDDYPVLIDQDNKTETTLIRIPFTQVMWFLLIPPSEVAENPHPKEQLRNYYFNSDTFYSSTKYYEIVRSDFILQPCENGAQTSVLVLAEPGFEVYECPPSS